MIELYGDATGNCIRAAIAFEESGLPYQLRKVDLTRGDHQQPEHLRLNPYGRVPVLVDPDGPQHRPFVLTQSNAILIYVSEKSGRLLPHAGAARATTFEWLLLFVTDVIAPNHQGFHLARALGDAVTFEVIRTLNRRAVAMYGPFNQQLSEHAYAAGATLTIADIAAYTITSALTSHLPWDDLPHVRRWFGTLTRRPGFQRGMAAFR